MKCTETDSTKDTEGLLANDEHQYRKKAPYQLHPYLFGRTFRCHEYRHARIDLGRIKSPAETVQASHT